MLTFSYIIFYSVIFVYPSLSLSILILTTRHSIIFTYLALTPFSSFYKSMTCYQCLSLTISTYRRLSWLTYSYHCLLLLVFICKTWYTIIPTYHLLPLLFLMYATRCCVIIHCGNVRTTRCSILICYH